LLAESLIARRELGRHRLQVSQTENTCKLCPWVLENTILACVRQPAHTVVLSVILSVDS
jgi:hypothetical protein